MSEPKSSQTDGQSAVATAPRQEQSSKPHQLPPYNVVLMNDNDHTYDYVIEMLKALFGHPHEMGFQLAATVDKTGRAIVLTTTKEHAELKRDQIHAFGRDWRIEACAGSMSAVIEPADGS